MTIDWGTVLSSALVAAILGPTISYFILRNFHNEDSTKLATLREDLTRETKRLDSERATLEHRFQTQYSWLYRKRAKTMSQVYQALIEASDAFEAFTGSWGQLPGDTKGPTDKWMIAREAGHRYTTAFRNSRLLFPKQLAEALAKINREFVAIFNNYRREIYLANGDEHKAILEMFNKNQLTLGSAPETIIAVEREFRRLYGSEANPG
jgi:hypothetical protein